MWTVGIEPTSQALQACALPHKPGPRLALLRDSAASGFRSHDLPRDKRTLCLSELWRRDELQIVKERFP